MPVPRVAVIFDNIGPYHWARLGAAGRECELLAIEVRDECPEHGWVRQERQVPFQTKTLISGASEKKPRLRDLSDRVARVLAAFKPQVVFLPGWSCAAAFVAQNWCNLNSVPAVVMSESNSWDEPRFALKEWVKRRLTRMYAAALVGGNAHRQYMVELGMPAERVFLGYDAVDNGYFEDKTAEIRKQKAEIKKKYGLPENYFLASARFVEKKNLSRLLQAYARYRKLCEARGPQDNETTGQQDHRSSVVRGPSSSGPTPVVSGPVVPWSLVLLGDGPLRSSIFNLRSLLGLDDCVLLPGFKQYDELPVYYGLASAFVHASTMEQWGLVVNEAMASGLPVLVSNRCGCALDLVQEGKNGFTFDPYNVEQLADLMFQISLRGVGPSGPEAAFQPFRLSAFGSASRKIISNWGTGRFGEGVSAAVGKALEVGAPRTSLFDRVFLHVLAKLR